MSHLIRELLLNYSRLGVEHWNRESRSLKVRARDIGVDIAENQTQAEIAVAAPVKLNDSTGRQPKLVPMPCGQRRVYAAFFVPWFGSSADLDQLCFDLVVLTQQGKPIAFRFEPGSKHQQTTHGYDHVQLNETLIGGQTILTEALSPLPTTYPAFPIPSKSTVTRFLAMAITMHGYPKGIDTVIRDAFNGQSRKALEYWNLTKNMLSSVS